jgi:hypothetical protein
MLQVGKRGGKEMLYISIRFADCPMSLVVVFLQCIYMVTYRVLLITDIFIHMPALNCKNSIPSITDQFTSTLYVVNLLL